MNIEMESRGWVFSGPYCCGWPILIPDRNSIISRSPDEYEDYDRGIYLDPNCPEGRAQNTSQLHTYGSHGGDKMQRYCNVIGRFRVLQCYYSYNPATFTEYAGLLESIPKETGYHFHSEQELEIGREYYPVRSRIVSLPNSNRTIRIAKARVATEMEDRND